jgi:polyisoprenoid-binding protein YceI
MNGRLVARIILFAAVAASLPAQRGPQARAADSLRLVAAGTGNTARYLVQEQLVGVDLASEAAGTTNSVTGGIVVAPGGAVALKSLFTIDVRRLRSDKDRRDSYVQSHQLETARYPNVTLLVTAVQGLHLPLATSGNASFTLKGDLTIRGVTKPTTWKVTAKLSDKEVSGKAATAFTFDDFSILQPHVPILLSVADTIKLEYDFRLLRK